ncbi:MAG: M20/M25/M40 family metallo-hydrolase [Bacteroidetes bacterium]|nr:M20/M25/M40 family metallo-hydrolase [Bacteroidota bacterium]
MKKFILTLSVFTASQGFTGAQTWFHADSIQKHINYLASDELEGRGTGTTGEERAASYIINEFKSFNLEPGAGGINWKQEFDFKAGTHGTGREGKANNVIGFLDNEAPFTIVIGAHYDHLGKGEDGHSLDAHAEGKIHNGADDNASGTAGVIELARFFAKNSEKEKFNFLFICFSGEELGLLGSEYFANHPTINLENVTCMINMDMVGRLKKDNPVLEVSGVGTAPEWQAMLQKFSSKAMEIKLDSAGVGPSDHTSFYNKNIPVLHFFTGTHSDYHKPEDDADKINAKGEEAVLLVISGVIARLPADRKLEFLKTRNPSMDSSTSFKVTLGIMPSYAGGTDGLKAEAVLDNKPAMKAGMKDGDIVIKMGDMDIHDIQDYMKALGKFEKGQTTTVVVNRNGEKVSLEVTF